MRLTNNVSFNRLHVAESNHGARAAFLVGNWFILAGLQAVHSRSYLPSLTVPRGCKLPKRRSKLSVPGGHRPWSRGNTAGRQNIVLA